MNYLDDNGCWSRGRILEGIEDVNMQLEDEAHKENVDESKITQLQFEKMLRGLYMSNYQYMR